MGLIGWLISVAGMVAVGVFAKILADDAKEWSPVVNRWLLRAAISTLPPSERAIRSEEWQATVDNTPGVLGKFIVALDLNRAARMWAWESSDDRISSWIDKLEEAAGRQALVTEGVENAFFLPTVQSVATFAHDFRSCGFADATQQYPSLLSIHPKLWRVYVKARLSNRRMAQMECDIEQKLARAIVLLSRSKRSDS